MFEKWHEPVAPMNVFFLRTCCHLFAGILFIVVMIGIGIVGFQVFEHLTLVDAFANSALTIADMGLISPPTTSGGRIFVGCFAVISGVVFFAVLGVIFAPIVHRVMHQLHVD